MTAIHYAIELERFEYLTHLFEGEQKQDYENDYSEKPRKIKKLYAPATKQS